MLAPAKDNDAGVEPNAKEIPAASAGKPLCININGIFLSSLQAMPCENTEIK